ncbi:factor of DNA methylation 2-like [Pistacia vera]|uniref:factor of DNA methylation 2-like n=1 Tax=Pistacia vera TaxID=55513 RepID=UPI001262CC6E|nr:factor of DNA methylation 2-like [Pistacia vera]
MHANFRKVTIGLTSKLITSDTSLKEKELMYQIEISSRDIRLLEMERKYKETCQGFEQLLAQKDSEKRSLMDQIEELKVKLQSQNPSEGDSDLTAEITELKNQLEENKEALQHSESLNQTLMLKESISNQELQDARKESISVLQDMLDGRTALAIKRMGEIDIKAFQHACSLKFTDGDWQAKSAQLCSSWEEHLRDPHWSPFKRVSIRGNLQEVIDDDDEKLKTLRNEYGEVAYEAVTNALLELNDYNPSGRFPVAEIWNSKERKRATLKEIIGYLNKQLNKRKRKIV